MGGVLMSEWECHRCGRCCTEFVMYSETEGAEQFFRLHGFQTRVLESGQVEARATAFCEWFVFADGHAICKHYDERPPTCRNFSCEKGDKR